MRLQYKYRCGRNATNDLLYCGSERLEIMDVIDYKNNVFLSLYGCKESTINGSIMSQVGILILRHYDAVENKKFMRHLAGTEGILKKQLNITFSSLMVPQLIHDTTHCYNIAKFFVKLPQTKKPIVQEASRTKTPKKQNIDNNQNINYSAIIYISVGVLCSSVTLTLICMIECQKRSLKGN